MVENVVNAPQKPVPRKRGERVTTTPSRNAPTRLTSSVCHGTGSSSLTPARASAPRPPPAKTARTSDGGGVERLVEPELTATGHLDRGHEAPALEERADRVGLLAEH